MNTIKKLSSNGFMLDSWNGVNNKWFTVDLKLIKSKTFKFPFENIKVGDVISGLKFKPFTDKSGNNKEYIIDYTIISTNNSEVKENSPINTITHKPNSLNSSPTPNPSSLTIVEGASLIERGDSINSLSDNNNVQSREDLIRYAQSVNLAFNSITLGGFLSEEEGIRYAFDRADKIFKEFNKRLK